MTILIAGGTGLIGRRLTELLIEKGHTVHILSRRHLHNKGNVKYFNWLVNSSFDQKALYDQDSGRPVDAIINLTGAGIADKRWSGSRKEEIINSRVEPARLLQNAMLDLKIKVPVYISASGVNYYSYSKSKKYHESDSGGSGFIESVCEKWERQAFKMENVADRVVVMRTGVVLGKNKSFLQKFTATTRIFVAGLFGFDNQFLSWIHIDDLCRFYIYAIENKALSGAYNAAICNDDTQLSFLKAYRRNSSKKFLILRAPEFIAKLVFGEMSIILIRGLAVSNQKMIKSGFNVRHDTIEKAIKNLV